MYSCVVLRHFRVAEIKNVATFEVRWTLGFLVPTEGRKAVQRILFALFPRIRLLYP